MTCIYDNLYHLKRDKSSDSIDLGRFDRFSPFHRVQICLSDGNMSEKHRTVSAMVRFASLFAAFTPFQLRTLRPLPQCHVTALQFAASLMATGAAAEMRKSTGIMTLHGV